MAELLAAPGTEPGSVAEQRRGERLTPRPARVWALNSPIVERLDPAPPTSRTTPAFKFKLHFVALLALGACNANSHASAGGTKPAATAEHVTAAATAPSSSSAPTSPAATVGKYGAPLGSAPAQSLASVLGTPDHFAGQSLQVEGHVRRACTAMGCWMELAESAAPDAPGCRVIMKDHAFFVPTDAAGSDAKVEGTLSVRHIDAPQVAHMESEGASFPHKAADGSSEEVRFVASGVELWRGS